MNYEEIVIFILWNLLLRPLITRIGKLLNALGIEMNYGKY